MATIVEIANSIGVNPAELDEILSLPVPTARHFRVHLSTGETVAVAAESEDDARLFAEAAYADSAPGVVAIGVHIGRPWSAAAGTVL